MGTRNGKRAARLFAVAGLVLLALPLSSGPASAADFSGGAITVPRPSQTEGPCPATPSECPSDKANPYPSTVAVSGVSGSVTDVNVVLNGLSYPALDAQDGNGPSDIDMQLVAPNGTSVMLMSDVCGDKADGTSNPIPSSAPITVTLDDSAGSALPADSACSSGTFKPADDDGDDENIPLISPPDKFPSPAPVAPTSTLPLSAFNGASPNGDWKLFIVDDGPDDPSTTPGGQLSGWTLQITGGGTTATTASTATTSSTSTTVASTTSTTATSTTSSSTTSTTLGAVVRLSSTTVAAGDRVTVAGDRLAANTTYQIIFTSAPVNVGSGTTNSAGSFQAVVTIPSDATAGTHTISLTDPAGRTVGSVNLTVTRGSTSATTGGLSRTGMNSLGLAFLAGTAILAGYFALSSHRTLGRRPPW